MKKFPFASSVVVLLLLSGCGQVPAPAPSPAPAPRPVTTPPSAKNEKTAGQTFIADVSSRVPSSYLKSVGQYPAVLTGDQTGVDTVMFSPCVTDAYPAVGLCGVRLLLWTEAGKTPSDYLKDEPFASYESVYGKKLVTGDLSLGASYIRTDFKNGFGTGAESALEKEYIFGFPDGTSARAMITYWPYAQDEDTRYEKTPQPMQDVIDAYDGILLKGAEQAH